MILFGNCKDLGGLIHPETHSFPKSGSNITLAQGRLLKEIHNYSEELHRHEGLLTISCPYVAILETVDKWN